jgi:hypothetical protein
MPRKSDRLADMIDSLINHVIPASFSPERPAFVYTHDQKSCSINQDPLASSLPKSTTTPIPSLYPGPEKWLALSRDKQASDNPT